MSTPTIDYDALAKQHGGSVQVDYDALAAQHGGTVESRTDSKPEKPSAYGFTPGNIISNVGSGLADLGKGLVQGASDIGGVILPQKMGGDAWNNLALVHHVVDPLQQQAAQARADFANKQTAAGVQHAIASGVPVVGPWYSGLTDQAASGDIGGAIAKGGTQMLAPEVGKNVLGAVGRAASKANVPQALYESALKPSTTISAADREAMVNTGIEKGIPVTKSGLDKLGDLVDDLNQKIKNEIAADPTRPISTVPAIRNLDSVRAQFSDQVTPQPDLGEIQQVEQNFLANPKVQAGNPGAGPGPSSLPASEAQSMKSGTYKALGDKAYGELKGANVEAQKALARGLKDEIARQFPEIDNLNAQESKLFDLGPVLEKAVNRAGNHQLLSLGTPAAATAGGLVFGSAKLGMAVGAMKMIMDNPMVKSKLAIALSKADKIPIGAANAKVNSYAASLAAYSASNGDSTSGQATQ